MRLCKYKKEILKVLVVITSLILLANSVSSVDDLLGFQANIYDSNGDFVSNGDITIEIWDDPVAGNQIFTNDFTSNISNGKVDVVLGELKDLSLNYGVDYYMDISVNGEDLDFSGNERRRFQSSIGNVTSNYIANAAITAAKILDNTLTELDIANGNLTSTVIADIFVLNSGDDMTGSLTIDSGYGSGGITLESGTGDLWVGGDIFVNGELVRVDASQINGSILFSQDEVFTIGNTTDKAAFIYTRDINISGSIYSLINSAERSINSWIETLISDTQANSTLLDSVASDAVLNETQRIDDNTTLGNMVIGSNSTETIQQLLNDTDVKLANLEVTGTSELGSFTIDSELIIGSSNFSSTNVGIGTTAPLATLDIVNTASGTITNGLMVSNDGSGVGTGATQIFDLGGTRYGAITAGYQIDGADYSTLDFQARNNSETYRGDMRFLTGFGAGNVSMFIHHNGKVGIGTTSPESALHVEKDANIGAGLSYAQILAKGTGGEYLSMGYDTTNDRAVIQAYHGTYKNLLLNPTGANVGIGGNLGIGTIDPSRQLIVEGISPGISLNTSGDRLGWTMFVNDGDGALRFRNYAVDNWNAYWDPIVIQNATQNVGIGLVAGVNALPSNHKLNVIGDVNITGLTQQGAVYSNGGVLTNTDPSSKEYKEDIEPWELDANRLLDLEVKQFRWKESGREDFGFIAEEINETVPELYLEDNTSDGIIIGYRNEKLVFYLFDIVKDLKNENKELKARIELLEKGG